MNIAEVPFNSIASPESGTFLLDAERWAVSMLPTSQGEDTWVKAGAVNSKPTS